MNPYEQERNGRKTKGKNTDEVENITDNTENGKEQNGGNEQQLMHEKPLQPEEENDTDKKDEELDELKTDSSGLPLSLIIIKKDVEGKGKTV